MAEVRGANIAQIPHFSQMEKMLKNDRKTIGARVSHDFEVAFIKRQLSEGRYSNETNNE